MSWLNKLPAKIPTICTDQQVLKLMTILIFYVSVLLKEPLGFSYRGRVSVPSAECSSWDVVVTIRSEGTFRFCTYGDF